MDTLSYKGIKSTRLVLVLVCMLVVTIAYVSMDVTAAQWLDFLKWGVGAYALSEVGAKGASAYKERNNGKV